MGGEASEKAGESMEEAVEDAEAEWIVGLAIRCSLMLNSRGDDRTTGGQLASWRQTIISLRINVDSSCDSIFSESALRCLVFPLGPLTQPGKCVFAFAHDDGKNGLVLKQVSVHQPGSLIASKQRVTYSKDGRKGLKSCLGAANRQLQALCSGCWVIIGGMDPPFLWCREGHWSHWSHWVICKVHLAFGGERA